MSSKRTTYLRFEDRPKKVPLRESNFAISLFPPLLSSAREQSSLAKLTEEKSKQFSHDSVTSENQILNSRVHELEEKLHDATQTLTEQRASSADKQLDIRAKLNREKDLEIQVRTT